MQSENFIRFMNIPDIFRITSFIKVYRIVYLPYLKNGKQVIISEAAHSPDIWGSQRPALDHMLKTFFKTGVVDDSRYTYSPISFEVGWSYPTIMKLILTGMVFILIILIYAVWLVIKKIRFKGSHILLE